MGDIRCGYCGAVAPAGARYCSRYGASSEFLSQKKISVHEDASEPAIQPVAKEVYREKETIFPVSDRHRTASHLYRHLTKWVKTLNEGSRPDKQIKPYNFVFVGSSTMVGKNGEPIIPLTQFTSEYGQAPYQPFIDAKSGKPYEENTELCWKKLDKTVEEYIDHPESKFENGQRCGTMRRRHLCVDSVVHIGKETNELDETQILGIDHETYVQYRKTPGPGTSY